MNCPICNKPLYRIDDTPTLCGSPECCRKAAEVINIARFIALNRERFEELDSDGVKLYAMTCLVKALGDFEKG